MNRTTAAFLIALLFHLLLILLWLIFISQIPQNTSKPKENKIKISLQEFHPPKPEKKSKFGREKKIIKKPVQAPPMPKGSQLKKIVQPKSHNKIKKVVRNIPHKEVPTAPTIKKQAPQKSITKQMPIHSQKKSTLNLSSKQPSVAHTSKDNNVSKHSKLYTFLSTPNQTQPDQSEQNTDDKRASQIQQNIKELYGTTFGKLSPGEQKYILDNTEIMRRITQQVLNRVGGVNIPNNLHVTTSNVVQFYLHPNGDMTGFKFLNKSNYYILDETTKETIEYAYSKYPRPKQTTLIRYKVNYLLGGY